MVEQDVKNVNETQNLSEFNVYKAFLGIIKMNKGVNRLLKSDLSKTDYLYSTGRKLEKTLNYHLT